MNNEFAVIRNQINAWRAPSIQDILPSTGARDTARGLSGRTGLLVLLGAVCLTGMLLGWLVIGWWLWPVEWTSSAPGQSSADYQQLFVTWVANKYWQTGDAAQAQKYLAEWKREDLAKFMLALQRDTTDAETRRHLVALTEALHLPVTESSLTLFIASQPGILLTVLLSFVPLLVALTFVAVPRMWKRDQVAEPIPGGATQPVESLDALLAEVNEGEQIVVPGQEKKAEEKEESPSEAAESQSSSLGDLASLFEEEDTSINVLEAFCKGMPEVDLDGLLTMATDIARRLHQGNRGG